MSLEVRITLELYYRDRIKDITAHGEHAPPVPKHDSEELRLVNGRLSTEAQVQIPNHLPPAALPSIEGRPLRPLKRSYAMLGES
jgi:hypothetical protein